MKQLLGSSWLACHDLWGGGLDCNLAVTGCCPSDELLLLPAIEPDKDSAEVWLLCLFCRRFFFLFFLPTIGDGGLAVVADPSLSSSTCCAAAATCPCPCLDPCPPVADPEVVPEPFRRVLQVDASTKHWFGDTAAAAKVGDNLLGPAVPIPAVIPVTVAAARGEAGQPFAAPILPPSRSVAGAGLPCRRRNVPAFNFASAFSSAVVNAFFLRFLVSDSFLAPLRGVAVWLVPSSDI